MRLFNRSSITFVLASLASTLALGGCGAADTSGGAEDTAQAPGALAAPAARMCGDVADDEMRCHAVLRVGADGLPLAKTPTPSPSGLKPADLQAAYALPSSTGGTGMTVALVDAYDYANAEKDLGVYRSTFGLPPCTTANGCFKKVNQQGAEGPYPKPNAGWNGEAALDIQMVSAVCPSCKIILVEADSSKGSDLGASVDTAATLGANAISNSYGGKEGAHAGHNAHYHHAGIAVTASSGDSGYGVSFPASSQWVTAVGGTHLVRSTSSRGWSETAWSGAGAGCSAVVPKPAWQTDKGCANRTVADVSAVADPATGVAYYESGWGVVGGTSVASPIIAAVFALAGGSFGPHAPYANASSLNDVTSGHDGSCGGSYLCTAGVGYDGPTGLGTPAGVGAF